MRRTTLLLLAALALVLTAPAATAATQTIQITRSGFAPKAAPVTVGDTVVFHNADTVNHQVVADDGSFASPTLKPGDTFTYSPTKAGKVSYHDTFNPKLKGSITVNGPPAGVSLRAGSQVIVFGGATTLSGTTTTQQSGEQVTLTAQRFDLAKTVQQAATATTQSGGTFQFSVAPTVETTYVVHYKSAASAPLTIFVRPRVGFGFTRGIYTAKVSSELGYGGHYLFAQRYAPLLGKWVNVKRVYLSTASRARFRLALPRHRLNRVRLFLPGSQAGAGYIAGISRSKLIRT